MPVTMTAVAAMLTLASPTDPAVGTASEDFNAKADAARCVTRILVVTANAIRPFVEKLRRSRSITFLTRLAIACWLTPREAASSFCVVPAT
ncbi:MAG: hypothetical protein FWD53_08605 [Phycisphaerales bacterium]|nr:hypothetical protein [Phycisphaerales bacterium]